MSINPERDFFNSCSCGAQIAENKTQNLMLGVAELQCTLKNEGTDEEGMVS